MKASTILLTTLVGLATASPLSTQTFTARQNDKEITELANEYRENSKKIDELRSKLEESGLSITAAIDAIRSNEDARRLVELLRRNQMIGKKVLEIKSSS